MDYPLPPIVHPDVENLLREHTRKIYQLLDLFESPLELVFPGIMQATIRQFRQIMDDAAMSEGRIYFAAKANKSEAFLAACAYTKIGVDVSSEDELQAALSNGVTGETISVSGPTKPPELLALACVHNARIGIDEPSELDALLRLSKTLALSHRVRVYLRMASVFGESRFGMDSATISKVLERLGAEQSGMQFDGYSFHVAGYATHDRVEMINVACEKLLEADSKGLRAQRIDIGGGLATTYANSDTWNVERATNRAFVGGFKPSVVYPYAAQPSGYRQLYEILNNAHDVLAATSEKLNRRVIIDTEPGRSLLDQAGITVFRVRGLRTIGGRPLVVVDGNSRALSDSFDDEFLVDPLLVTNRAVAQEPFAAAIASNTCKEEDFLARRFIPMPFKPAVGDLLVYVNTAGYQMDSKESSFHRLPIPPKIVARQTSDGWRFIRDQAFNLANLTEYR